MMTALILKPNNPNNNLFSFSFNDPFYFHLTKILPPTTLSAPGLHIILSIHVCATCYPAL